MGRDILGSSPLARGPQGEQVLIPGVAGLIPARAGTTAITTAAGAGTGAHPRSRGDHPLAAGGSRASTGSSPLARGPRAVISRGNHFGGLIPARAGTTGRDIEDAAGVWAHPRSRGDHAGRREYEQLREGSSPLARGPLVSLVFGLWFVGLIPARAGTTKADRR